MQHQKPGKMGFHDKASPCVHKEKRLTFHGHPKKGTTIDDNIQLVVNISN
jgi:hypothetical protein